MTLVDPAQRLAAALRLQSGTVRERGKAGGGSAARAQAPGGSRGAVPASLAQRIAAIPPDAPDRPRRAVRLYLEAELAREFGRALLNDPEFPALLDAVQQRMEEDAQTAAAVGALGRLLLAGPAPRA